MSARKLVYQLVYVAQIWRLFRWINRGKVKILMYHGVTDQPLRNWTQVDTASFERQMRYISRHYHPVSLEEAVEMLTGSRPVVPHAVVVTFDDGFKNNLTAAYPILQRYGVPATIFIATSFIEGSPRFGGLIWTDFLYALFDATPCEEVDLSDLGLGTHKLSTVEQRYEAKDRISRHLKQVDYQEKNRLIEELGNRLGRRIRPDARVAFAPLTWDEMRQLQSMPLIRFGAHTENHEILSRLPEPVMVQEIVGSQVTLREKLNAPIAHFAYPNGTSEDFTDRTAEVVEKHFTCALTTVPGQNAPGEDLYKLRRIPVGRDTSYSDFKLSLSGVTDFLHSIKRAIVPGNVAS